MSTPTARPQTVTDEGMSRRALLQGSAAGGVGLALSGSLSALFGPEAALAHGHGHGPHEVGYGPLVPDPAGILSLPEDFNYKIIAQAGVTTLDSGEPTPSDADGTASYVRRGGKGSVLVMNHEIGGGEPFGVPHLAGLVYDPTRRTAVRRTSRWTATATGSASTSASPAPTTTAPAGGRRGRPG